MKLYLHYTPVVLDVHMANMAKRNDLDGSAHRLEGLLNV